MNSPLKISYIEVTRAGIVSREVFLSLADTVGGLKIKDFLHKVALRESVAHTPYGWAYPNCWQGVAYTKVMTFEMGGCEVQVGAVEADTFTYAEYLDTRATGDTSAAERYYRQYVEAVRMSYPSLDLTPFENSTDPNFNDVSFWTWRSLWDTPSRWALQARARSLGEGLYDGFLTVDDVKKIMTVVIREMLAERGTAAQ